LLLGIFTCVCGFQLAVIFNNGFSERLGNIEDYVNQAKAITYPNGAEKGAPRNPFVVIGDSHARVFSHPVKGLATEQNRPFVQMVRDGCPLVKNTQLYQDGKLVPACSATYEPRIKAIEHFNRGIYFYSGRFALYQNGQRFAEEPGYPVLLTSLESGNPSPKTLFENISQTIEDLLAKNIKLVLVYPIPEMGFDVPKKFVNTFGSVDPLELKQRLRNDPLFVEREKFEQRAKDITDAFDAINDSPNLIRLRPSETLCDALKCYAHDDQKLYYYDDNHLSPGAAQALIDQAESEMKSRGWIE
jgi:hypothetical protein